MNKIIYYFLFIILLGISSFPQQVLADRQELFIKPRNGYFPCNTIVTIILEPISNIYCRDIYNVNNGYNCSNCPGTTSVDIWTLQNCIGSENGWTQCNSPSGFNYQILGYCLYKLSVQNRNAYIYLDYRDCNWGNSGSYGYGNIDLYIFYDYNNDKFYNDILGTLSNGNIIRIWETPGSLLPPNTSCFPAFWANCLVLTNNNWNPQLIWCAHPTFNPISGYKIYRKVVNYGQNPGQPASWPLLTTVNANTFSYKDIEFRIGGTSYQAYYYVRAYYSSIQSDLTNIVNSAVQYYKNKNESEAQSITGFILEQNFPNPFNPTTKITYSIPEESFIQLKVFDPFGNEVSLLVNEKKDKGIYEVEFDASNFASGIYFYQLKTNNFISTKKMIVLK